MSTLTRPRVPVVHTYDDEHELVVQVELPTGDDGVRINVTPTVLEVHVPVPTGGERHWWNADATPC